MQSCKSEQAETSSQRRRCGNEHLTMPISSKKVNGELFLLCKGKFFEAIRGCLELCPVKAVLFGVGPLRRF